MTGAVRPLGRSNPQPVSLVCGSASNCSNRPSSSSSRSVEGCTVSPRKSRRKSACFSSTVTSTPPRASSSPAIIPAGPPPTITHVVFSLIASSSPRCDTRLRGNCIDVPARAKPLCRVSPCAGTLGGHVARGERLAIMGDTGTLVLLRHGESEWNASNQFTGWVDVNLTDKGRGEAGRGGELLTEHNLLPDVLYTSLLRRAITTAHLALDAADRLWIPVHRTWRLNERHYGALQGLDKAEIRERYGDEQFMTWRRSYDTPPPPIEKGSQFSQDTDPRYADIGGGPLTECLADVVARFLPYFTDVIVPDLRVGKTVLIAAHGNSLRALVKYLDGMSDEEVVSLNIPTGIPLRYDLDADMRPAVVGGSYLDPEAAAAGAAAVASQGAR